LSPLPGHVGCPLPENGAAKHSGKPKNAAVRHAGAPTIDCGSAPAADFAGGSIAAGACPAAGTCACRPCKGIVREGVSLDVVCSGAYTDPDHGFTLFAVAEKGRAAMMFDAWNDARSAVVKDGTAPAALQWLGGGAGRYDERP
jgi:hypothetical protein